MKTGNKPQKPRCALASCQPNPMDAEGIKRDAWVTSKILVVSMEDERLGWAEKKMVEVVGDRLYGERGD